MDNLPKLRFQVSVHGIPPASVASTSLAVSFDSAFVQLSLLARLFIEPDGSFVWRGTDAGGSEWQVDGNLIDQGESLAYVELKGNCPEEQFDELLRTLGWPQQALAFQLPRRGVLLEESEFRRLAASDEGAI
jgi:hypothetical protein